MLKRLHQDIFNNKISVIGLGYVGLPLALSFGEKFKTVGYDISCEKIELFKNHIDPNKENTKEDFERAKYIQFSCDPDSLKDSHLFIITVPTPLKDGKIPDLSHLEDASKTVGKYLKEGTIVVYESTVYPGVTEEFCAPILERVSGLKAGKDFKLGYSPERMNPGDKEHSLKKITKVVSAQDEEALEIIARYYEAIIDAGVYRAKSIRIAEAAKVIENTQRDLNIALMNELSIIFDRLGIDTKSVLETAATKWNFIPFKPGLVGGHCIGVDPYYLTYCAQLAGYHPEVILAGRRINDSMGYFIANKTLKLMLKTGIDIKKSTILICGITFKENCADVRNSRVFDIIEELLDYGIDVTVHDPIANPADVHKINPKINFTSILPENTQFDTIIFAVSHREYITRGIEIVKRYLKGEKAVIIDVKSIFSREDFPPNFTYWRL